MSAQEIIEEIKHLPANERAEVTKFVVESDDSWVPESFKRGMAEAAVISSKQPDFLARAKKIWGEKPDGKPLSELVSDARGGKP